MSCFVKPAAIRRVIESSTAAYCCGVAITVTRSKRTAKRPRPWLTVANGAVWICPLSAIEQIQRSTGGSRSSARNADGSALFCAWIRGPRSGALGWLAGHVRPSSAYAIDHIRSVSGGRPVIDHAQATQRNGELRTSA